MDAWLRLTAVPGIAYGDVKALLGVFGDPEDVFDAPAGILARGAGEELAARILSREACEAAEAAEGWRQRPGCSVMTFIDPGYPRELLAGGSPPPLLWLRGNPAHLALGKISACGTETPDREGLLNAEGMAAAIVRRGVALVSTLGEGTGEAAVRGALAAGGAVIGVTATGPDVASPARRKPFFQELLARGGLIVSLFPPGTQAAEETESCRLQAFAALASAHVVIQAGRSARLFAFARAAAEYGRELMAVPGTIHSPLYKGNHQLLRQGARLVESGEDIFAGWERIDIGRRQGRHDVRRTESWIECAPHGGAPRVKAPSHTWKQPEKR